MAIEHRVEGECGLFMTPPKWRDEHGRPRLTRPCPRCGREVPVRFKGFRAEHLKHVGWRAFNVETYVNWCGHAQEVIPIVDRSGGLQFIPVLGEAR